MNNKFENSLPSGHNRREAKISSSFLYFDKSNPIECDLANLHVQSHYQIEDGNESMNKANILVFENGKNAIYKPGINENYLFEMANFPGVANNLYKNERQSYVYDSIMGFHMIPETVIRNIPEIAGIGSVQKYVNHQRGIFEMSDKARFNAQMYTAALEHYLLWNVDGKFQHFLLEEKPDEYIFNANREESIKSIDLGLTFYPWKGSSVFNHLKGNLNQYVITKDAPAQVIEESGDFLLHSEKRKRLEKSLSTTYPSYVVQACLARTERVAQALYDKGYLKTYDIFNTFGELEFYPD